MLALCCMKLGRYLEAEKALEAEDSAVWSLKLLDQLERVMCALRCCIWQARCRYQTVRTDNSC